MKKSELSLIIALVFAGSAAAFLTGCRTEDDYKAEHKENVAKVFKNIKSREFLKGGQKVSLKDCINFAIDNNLSLKVANMEKDVRERMRNADLLGILPDVTISDTFTSRNNLPGSSSKAVVGDGASFEASRSADKDINNLSVDFAFSMLDCGLAFFNSQQSHDRMLQQAKAVERMKQNIALDVTKLYFKVAVAQRAEKIAKDLLKECDKTYTLIKELHSAGKINALTATEEMNKFLKMQRRLEDYIRANNSARTELRAMLGVYPGEELNVNDSILDNDKLPAVNWPSPKLMEQIAVLKRPELYETDIQRHINITECRKTLLMMLPHVRLYGDFIHNDNSFLMNQSWWDLAVRAAYNLLKTPHYIYRYKAFNEQASLEELRSFVQAITVISQVHMANKDITACEERYDLNKKDHKNYQSFLAKAGKKAPNGMKKLELTHLRMIAAETQIEKLISLGACHIAQRRLLNALGLDSVDATTLAEVNSLLDLAKISAEDRLQAAADENRKKNAEMEKARIARVLFERGVDFYNVKKYVEAVEYLKRAAEEGSAEASFCLGKIYYTGKGEDVKPDPVKGVKYIIQAADRGKKEAQLLAGWSYYKGENVKKDLELAKKYYRMAADNADERAFYWLGVISYDMKDYKDAMYYFKYAARGNGDSLKEGDAGSMVWVGTLYRNGLGEKADYNKAIMWFTRAADKGNVDAMNCLYMMYAGGYGCPPDKVKADEWLKKYENATAY